MISPQEYPWLTETSSQPFTETPMPTNIKPRIVYCENCKYRITTDLPAPKCGICERFLIKILKTHELVE